MKLVFDQEYSIFNSKSINISFDCCNCNKVIDMTIELPRENLGDSKGFKCSTCGIEFQTEVFQYIQGGCIKVNCKEVIIYGY